MSEESTPVKRRRRGELETTIREERYSQETLSNALGHRDLLEKTPDEIRVESKKNRQKVQPHWAEVAESSSTSFHTPVNSGRGPVQDRSGNSVFFEKRRDAVCILFQMMGSPEERYWEKEGIITNIMNRMMINQNTRSRVMGILRNVLVSEVREQVYDANENLRKRGRKMLIVDFDPNARSLYNSLATGCGIPAAADILNLSLRASDKLLGYLSFRIRK